MANWVKIATFATHPLRVREDISPKELTERMIEHWTARLKQAMYDRPDVIVLAEACDRPADYSMDKRRAYYCFRQDQVRDAMAALAKENRCYIAYSAARQLSDETFRNSTVMIGRKGEICGTYNKNHLVVEETTMAGILCGKDAPIIETDFGRVACMICFDLNFDELRNKYAAARPDLILFSSMYHGGMMQAYTAYRCRSHFVGAVAGLPSEIRNPLGEVLARTTNYTDYVVASVNLDCQVVHLDYNEGKLVELKRKYGPDVTIYDPGLLGSVLITSNAEHVTAKEMVKEFQIEQLDDYMARALAHRKINIEP